RADDLLPPAAALSHTGAARARAGGEHRAAGAGRGIAVCGHPRAAARAAVGGAARRSARRAPVFDRALLRAHDRLAGSRPVGLAAPRDERFVGGRGGHAMIRRALDVAVSLAALLLSAPLFALALLAIRLETPGPVIYRQRRAGRDGRAFDVFK